MSEIIKFCTGAFLAVGGLGLLFAGIYTIPIGIIDSSVLMGVGQVLIYSGSIFGVRINVKETIDELKNIFKYTNEKGKDK